MQILEIQCTVCFFCSHYLHADCLSKLEAKAQFAAFTCSVNMTNNYAYTPLGQTVGRCGEFSFTFDYEHQKRRFGLNIGHNRIKQSPYLCILVPIFPLYNHVLMLYLCDYLLSHILWFCQISLFLKQICIISCYREI